MQFVITCILMFQKITQVEQFAWYTADGTIPKDIPVCGFFGELCPPPVTKGRVITRNLNI